MVQLKTRTKTVIHVDYDDLDTFLQYEYGLDNDWTVIANEEWSNYESHEFDIQPQILNKWDAASLEKFIESRGRGGYMVRTLLTDLCNQGKIPAGTYLIKVYW